MFDRLLDQLLTDSEPLSNTENSSCYKDLIGNRELVVYGHGGAFHGFSKFILKRLEVTPAVILDTKFREPLEIDGVMCLSPLDYRPTPKTCHEAVAVISIGKDSYYQEALDSLRKHGFRNIIRAMDIHEYNLAHSSEDSIRQGRQFFIDQQEKIKAAYKLLGDGESCNVFLQVLKRYITRENVPIPCDLPENQYFPSDINMQRGVERTINCGSYDGDTLRSLHAHHGKIESLICLEPDEDNFARLSAYLAENAEELAETIIVLPCAVWGENSKLSFNSHAGPNSSIVQEGDVLIQAVALDDLCYGFHPTFINMDIEGAEPEALRGAKGIICRDRPDLAVCVFHKMEHLWDIPLYLHQLNPGYRFFMRNYTGYISETVLYATDPSASIPVVAASMAPMPL